MESIEVINPRVTIQNYNWHALNKGKPEVWDNMFLYTELNEAFKFTYRGLADLSFLLNDYINTSVKNNPGLLKEIELDENTNLKVSAESDKVLIFKHNYTEKGMVKRNSSTEASTLLTDKLEAVPIPPRKNNNAPGSTQIPTTKSTSTSPVGANKKPGVILKPRPKSGSKPVIKN